MMGEIHRDDRRSVAVAVGEGDDSAPPVAVEIAGVLNYGPARLESHPQKLQTDAPLQSLALVESPIAVAAQAVPVAHPSIHLLIDSGGIDAGEVL